MAHSRNWCPNRKMSVPSSARDGDRCPQCNEAFDDTFSDVPSPFERSDEAIAEEEMADLLASPFESEPEPEPTPDPEPAPTPPAPAPDPNLPEAGWYQDPAGGGRQRYWDGDSWTHDTRGGTPTAPAPSEPVENVAPRGWDWKWLLFSFEGRAHRAHYWGGGFVAAAIFAAIVIIGGILGGGSDEGFGVGLILGVIPWIWMGLAVNIKRWHDRNKPGAWVLIQLIPYIGGFWVLIECGMLEGTRGPNRYGPDPRGQGSF